MKAKRLTKIALLVAGGFTIVFGLVLAYTIWSYASRLDEPAESAWQPENRIILAEYVAPDSSSKIGVYHYDMGGLGYTTVNVSVVDLDEDYPIQANLFKSDKTLASVAWTDADTVLIRVYSDYGLSQGKTAPPFDQQKGKVWVRYELVERKP